MFRLIGIVIVLGLVAWLALRQVEDANATLDESLDSVGAAGIEIDRDAHPSEAVRAVGQHVEATVASGKSRIDDALEANARSDD
ncbi:MAG: hypothetical protein R3E65_10720 [Steroidobacteraceae bacterium]